MVRTKPHRPTVQITDSDLAIFRGLFESRLLTRDHIARLFRGGSYEATKKRIKALVADGYIIERERRWVRLFFYDVSDLGFPAPLSSKVMPSAFSRRDEL
jgi:hypothetical protein